MIARFKIKPTNLNRAIYLLRCILQHSPFDFLEKRIIIWIIWYLRCLWFWWNLCLGCLWQWRLRLKLIFKNVKNNVRENANQDLINIYCMRLSSVILSLLLCIISLLSSPILAVLLIICLLLLRLLNLWKLLLLLSIVLLVILLILLRLLLLLLLLLILVWICCRISSISIS